jgi:sulfonate transport system ATP-binding protein
VLDGGRIAHEVVIDIPRPRREGHPALVAHRQRLLDHLGVVIDAAP